MQAKSDSAMSISEGKAKGVPMTPTAQIAAIRQRAERAYPRGVSDIRHDGTPVYTQMGDPVADVRFLLAAWDTHQSALRALVAELRAAGEDDLNDYAVGYLVCADRVARLLESEP